MVKKIFKIVQNIADIYKIKIESKRYKMGRKQSKNEPEMDLKETWILLNCHDKWSQI